MKTRYGFVSNSSSSSFVVALPNGVKMDRDKIADALCPNGAGLRYLAVEIAKFMTNNTQKTTTESILSDWGYDSPAEIHDKLLRKAMEQNMDIYTGWASNDGDQEEQALCSMVIEFDSPEIIVSKTDTH